MQIIKFINSLPRKIMLWSVTYGCFYEIIIRPIGYYIKFGVFIPLNFDDVAMIISIATVLGICRTYEKKQRLIK